MARKTSSRDAAKSLLAGIQPKAPAQATEVPATASTPVPVVDIKAPPAQIAKPETPKAAAKKALKQCSIYLREDQIKAIKLESIQSDRPEHKDISAIVRAAVDAYLNL